MGRLRHYTGLIKAFLHFGVCKLAEYPLNTIISFVSMLLREVVGFIGIFLIAQTMGGFGGWNMYEICVLFALAMISEALGQAFFDMVWSIGFIGIKIGMLDVFLVRPAPVLLQVFCFGWNFSALISAMAGGTLFCYGFLGAGGTFTIENLLFILETILFGTMINTSIYLIFNCLNFWVVQANEIASLIQTVRQFGKYPMTAFPVFVRMVLTFGIPFGFVAYYPAAYLLGKTGLPVPTLLAVTGIVVAGISGIVWRMGLKSYNSTGT